MRRTREKLAQLLNLTRDSAQRDIPAGNLRDQIPLGNIPRLNLTDPDNFYGVLGRPYGGTGLDGSATGPGVLKQAVFGGVFSIAPLEITEIEFGLSGYDSNDVFHGDGVAAPIDLGGTGTNFSNVLASTLGGTGVNNGGRNLTINTNSGTLAFSAAGKTLTIPDTGTAALLGATQTFSAVNTFSSNIRVNGVDVGLNVSSDYVTRHGTSSTGTLLRISPNGNGLTNSASLQMFNTDWSASQTNFELFTVGWNNNTAVFLSQNGGTGTVRDMLFSVTGGALMRLTAGGNFGIFGTSFGASSVGVIAIANRTTAPTGNPTGGGVLYAAAGAGTWRGSGGTVTTFAPAGPHCERCGYDAWTVAMRNAAWRAYCYICGVCGAIYKAGPQSVLNRLGPEEWRQIIRPGMSYQEIETMLA